MKVIYWATAAVLFFSLLPVAGYSQADSFSFYFPSGVSKLDARQTAYLDSILYLGKIPGPGLVAIVGYADEPGGVALNKMVSENRAAALKAYLLSSGVEESRVLRCSGAGNVRRTGKDDGQRRVDVLCLKSRTLPPWLQSTETKAGVRSDTTTAVRKPKRSLRDLGGMKEDELLEIENLLFKLSTAEIEKSSLPVLNELVEVLKDYPRLKIRIEGHICCASKSNETDKLKLGYSLSKDRAEAVRDYLVEHQIAPARLSYTGFGFSRPKVYPEKTPEDMAQNRRVEIRVISN